MRIGIIGTRWGLMHVGAFRGAGAEVVALCGHDRERTRHVAAREGVPLATTDVEELCAACEAVVVAGPDALHREHVAAALAAGRPVLCEKPLTRTVEEAEELLALDARGSPVCAVAFATRLLPPLAALRARLLTLGPVRQAVATVRSSFAAAQTPGRPGEMMGASGDFGGMSHAVDAALWLCQAELRWVQATLSGRPVHSAMLHVGLDSGCAVALSHLAAPAPGIDGRWLLIGDDWQAEWSAGYQPALGGWSVGPVLLSQGGDVRELAARVAPEPGGPEPRGLAHVDMARAFLRLLRTGERGALATFHDGAQVQRVLAGAMRAESEGRRVTVGV